MYDVIIGGGASAGLAAAIYTSRQELRTLLLTKDIGDQAVLTPHIEKYPGFDTISSPELMEKFQQQATNFGTEFRYEEVKRITRTDSRGDGSYGSQYSLSLFKGILYLRLIF
jgi:thioredoxin reductase